MVQEPIRILLMEDDPGQARLFQKRMRGAGYMVDHAPDGEQGLAMYDPAVHALVATDHAMPIYDGLEVIRRLASRGPLPPLIMVTGTGNEQVAVEAMKLGARDYIVKDVDGGYLDLLPSVIDRTLRQHHLEEQMRLSEEALAESERRFRDIADNSAEWIWEVDHEGRFTYCSPVVRKLLGYEPEELMGKPFYEYFHPDDREGLKKEGLEILALMEPFRDFVGRIISKTGQDVWMSTSGVPIRNELGKFRGYRGASVDITSRRRAEEALRASERFLANIFDSIQDGISILDTDFTILRANSSMERWCARALPLEGKKCFAAYHGRESPCEVCPSRRTLKTGQATVQEMPMPGAGEEWGCAEVYTFPFIDPLTGKSKGVIEYTRDISQQKQAEEALRHSEENLRQAQKMEAIGRLAGGVAHDFNNILTAIIGYCELLRTKFEARDSRRLEVEEIQKAGERAASLTRQLLAFSRKQIFSPKVLNLNALVADLDKMLRRLISEDIKLAIIPGAALDTVMADPGQIEQVIINLVVNARDSMPQGGIITIETQDAFLNADFAQKAEVAPGDYVLLEVRDTGHGMDAAALGRVFEPFFTTKELGKGTGLGLSTVHGIVKQSGGHVDVDSKLGEGTTFRIFLPRLDQPAVGVAAAAPRCSPDQGTETILLVEDEDLVRRVARRILEIKGYTVLEADSGPDALLMSQQAKGPIHLVVTDVVMPGMSGRETADLLKAQRPEMRVLYMSGHTENAIVHHGVLDPGIAFIQKPFRQEQLAAKVREVLDNQPAGHARA